MATVKTSLVDAFKVFPSMFKTENVEISQFLETKTNTVNKSKKGIKRSATDGVLKKGTLFDTFKKRSRTENDIQSITRRSPVLSDVDEDVVSQAEKDLDVLIKIACKLSQDTENLEIQKKKEVIVDVNHLELSLDVPNEKIASRKAITMDISLDQIRKTLENVGDQNEHASIKVR